MGGRRGTESVPVGSGYATRGRGPLLALLITRTAGRLIDCATASRSAPRNSVIGPGFANMDLAIAKTWPFVGTSQVEFRWEIFNVINHVNYNAPVTALNSASFGQIQSAGDPRIMQFALKVDF